MAKPGFKASVSSIVTCRHPKIPSVCRALSCLNQYLAWRRSHKKRKAKSSPSLPRFKDQFPGNFLDSSAGKESACNAGDLGSIPGLGRSPGEGKGYPLQYSGLENSMDCIVHGVAKSQTQLSDFHFWRLVQDSNKLNGTHFSAKCTAQISVESWGMHFELEPMVWGILGTKQSSNSRRSYVLTNSPRDTLESGSGQSLHCNGSDSRQCGP